MIINLVILLQYQQISPSIRRIVSCIIPPVSQESYPASILVLDCRFAPIIDYNTVESCCGEFILTANVKI